MSVSAGGRFYLSFTAGPLALRVHRRRVAVCFGLTLLLILSCLGALATGSGQESWADLWHLLVGQEATNAAAFHVIGTLRLPRVLLAISTGAMLGLSGASLQTLSRNGLADPGLLGVREGASLAVICLMLTIPTAPLFARPMVGMTGGLAAALAAIMLAGTLSRMRFVLVGIGVSWMLSALLMMILTASDIDRVEAAMVWMAGSLSSASAETVPLSIACLLVGTTCLMLTARAAEVGSLGDATAVALGVSLRPLFMVRLAVPVFLTATAVSCAGSVGFVGLIAPHLSRLMIGGGQVPLLVGSAIIGSGLVLAADTAGRTLFAPLQIPAGIGLAMIGVPVLLALLWRQRDKL